MTAPLRHGTELNGARTGTSNTSQLLVRIVVVRIIHILYGLDAPAPSIHLEGIKLVDTGHAEWSSGRPNLHRRGHVCGIFGLLDPRKFDDRNLERIELVLDVRARIFGAYSCAQQVLRVSP